MIKRLVYGFLLFLGVGLVLFYFFQERLIFLNGKKLTKDFNYQFTAPFTEVNLKTADGQTLNAVHFTLEKPKGVILFFHGNKGNLTRWGTIVPYLLAYNYEVFVMDYRGYGKSTGAFNEANMYTDALLAYEHVKQQYTEDQIVVYGRSLGSTFAAHVASKNSPKHVVLEAPFYSLKQATQYYFFLSPTFLLRYQFETCKDLPKVSSPLTIFHGDADRTTSFEESKNLFQTATTSSKEFVRIEGGTHHNVTNFKMYKEKLAKLLEDN